MATSAGGIHSLESIPGLHERLTIRALLNNRYRRFIVGVLHVPLAICQEKPRSDSAMLNLLKGHQVWDLDLLDSNDFYVMKSLWVGDFEAGINFFFTDGLIRVIFFPLLHAQCIYAYNLLPNAQWMLLFVATRLEYSNKGNHTLFLRFQLTQWKSMKKVKAFFGANSKIKNRCLCIC